LVVQAASQRIRQEQQLWLEPAKPTGSDTFALMQRMKSLFDPHNILNPSRLYGRL
jgi:FAD/FMN-containing dehydrogenase